MRPTPGWAASVATSFGWRLLELLDGEAMVVAGEPDEPEVAGADDRDRGFVGRRRDVLLVEVDDAVRRLVRERGPRHGGSDALAARDLREERVHEGRSLSLRLRLDHGRATAHQIADNLAQALAVALLEGRPEALPMVGEHDEPVGSRGILGGFGEVPIAASTPSRAWSDSTRSGPQ